MYWTICFILTLGILVVVYWICTRNCIDNVEDRLDRRLLELEAYVDCLDNVNRHRLNDLEPSVLRLKKELEDMKNIEKCKKDILKVLFEDLEVKCCKQIRNMTDLEKCAYGKCSCGKCINETVDWLFEEAKEYTEIEVMNGDCLTPGQEVLVNDSCRLPWQTRKFLAYYGGKFYCLDECNHAFAYDHCKIMKEV